MNNIFNITILILFTIICIYLLNKSCNYKELFANQDNIIQYPFNLSDTVDVLTSTFNNKISQINNNLTSPIANINNLTSTSLLSTTGFINNLTSTSLLSTNGSISNLTSSNLLFNANGSISNLSNLYVNNINFGTNGSITNLNNLKINNLTSTSLLSTTGFINNLTSTSLLSTNGSISNLTSTSLLSTNGSISNLTSSNLLFNANGSISNLSNLYVNNIAFGTNGSITNLNNLKVNNLTSTSLLSTNGSISNLTSTSLLSTNGSISNLTSSNLLFNANGSISNLSNLYVNNINFGTNGSMTNLNTLNIGDFNLKQSIANNKKTLELKQGTNTLATFTSDDATRIKLFTDNTNNISIDKSTDGVNVSLNNLVSETKGGYTLNGDLNINGKLKIGNNITIKSDDSGDVITVGSGTTPSNGKTTINIGKYSLVPVLTNNNDYIELRYNDGEVKNNNVIGQFGMFNTSVNDTSEKSSIRGKIKVDIIESLKISSGDILASSKIISSGDISAFKYNMPGTINNYNIINDDKGTFTLSSATSGSNIKLIRYNINKIWSDTGDVFSMKVKNDGTKHMYAKDNKVDIGNLNADKQ